MLVHIEPDMETTRIYFHKKALPFTQSVDIPDEILAEYKKAEDAYYAALKKIYPYLTDPDEGREYVI